MERKTIYQQLNWMQQDRLDKFDNIFVCLNDFFAIVRGILYISTQHTVYPLPIS